MSRIPCARSRSRARSGSESVQCSTCSRTSPTLRVFHAFVLRKGMVLIEAVNDRAATKDEILHSGTTVASLFFKNVFGVSTLR